MKIGPKCCLFQDNFDFLYYSVSQPPGLGGFFTGICNIFNKMLQKKLARWNFKPNLHVLDAGEN
jgi:hypothetical protein